MLLYLLKEYHQVDASDAMVFFTDRVEEMKELPPNITEKSRRPEIKVNGLDGRTIQGKFGSRAYDNDGTARFYVLRGFFPDTNIPFKMVTVYATDKSRPLTPYDEVPKSGEVLHTKVLIGMRPHWTVFNTASVDKYKDHVSEAILLDQEPMETEKIKYKYRGFKCMRPKGMDLYRERNYEEKRKELNKIAYQKRKAKNDKQFLNERNRWCCRRSINNIHAATITTI